MGGVGKGGSRKGQSEAHLSAGSTLESRRAGFPAAKPWREEASASWLLSRLHLPALYLPSPSHQRPQLSAHPRAAPPAPLCPPLLLSPQPLGTCLLSHWLVARPWTHSPESLIPDGTEGRSLPLSPQPDSKQPEIPPTCPCKPARVLDSHTLPCPPSLDLTGTPVLPMTPLSPHCSG